MTLLRDSGVRIYVIEWKLFNMKWKNYLRFNDTYILRPYIQSVPSHHNSIRLVEVGVALVLSTFWDTTCFCCVFLYLKCSSTIPFLARVLLDCTSTYSQEELYRRRNELVFSYTPRNPSPSTSPSAQHTYALSYF